MLIEREGDAETCLAHIADTRPLVLRADAGIGKTALLQAASAACRRRTFFGQGLSTLSWVSYLSLETALDAEMPQGDPPSIAAVVRRRVGDGVLLLDDLQWADADTLDVLPFLARTRLLAAVRTDDPEAERVLSAVQAARFDIHELRPLTEAGSAALLRSRRSDLSPQRAREIARNSGGNPLLLEELEPGGTPSTSLRMSLAARLQRLSPQGQRAFGFLSLLARPAERELVAGDPVAEGLEELVRTGLVVETPQGFIVRHTLLGEAASERLGPRGRERMHAEIASRTSDPGEAALHHHRAGDRVAARRHALLAVDGTTRMGQRARLLSIAAQSGGDADEDDGLRLRAAEALIETGDHDLALSLSSAVRSTTPEVAAEALLYQARAALGMHSLETARRHAREGLALIRGSGSSWRSASCWRISRLRSGCGSTRPPCRQRETP